MDVNPETAKLVLKNPKKKFRYNSLETMKQNTGRISNKFSFRQKSSNISETSASDLDLKSNEFSLASPKAAGKKKESSFRIDLSQALKSKKSKFEKESERLSEIQVNKLQSVIKDFKPKV